MHSFSDNSPALSILVVDDEPAMLAILEVILRAEGHAVGRASSGEEALGRFQSERWDLVITDRAMPGMGGEELAQAIKQLSPRTPIIMVTGFAPPGCCSGVDEILHKPFSRRALGAAISRCLAAASPGESPARGELHAAA